MFIIDLTETQLNIENAQPGSSQDILMVTDAKKDLVPASSEVHPVSVVVSEVHSVPELHPVPGQAGECEQSQISKSVENTPKLKKRCTLTEIKKKNINSLSSSIIKRKNQKQTNEDSITVKKLEILEIQKQQEVLKLEKTRLIMDTELEFKGFCWKMQN